MTGPRLPIRDPAVPTWLSTAGRALELLVVLVAVSLLLGHALGQPVLLGYVQSGSMAPTLHAGDGFVAVPAAIAGPPAPGDVVVYRAEHLHGGGLVTHRVVAVGEAGLHTRGDGNVVTDQDAGEPPVQRPQVVAEVLTVGGSVVVVPGLGTAVEAVRGLGTAVVAGLATLLGGGPLAGMVSRLVVVLGLLGVAASGLRRPQGRGGGPGRSAAATGPVERGSRWLTRTRERAGGLAPTTVVAILAGLLVLSTTASMVVPGGVLVFGVVSAENDAPGTRVIHQGGAESFGYPVTNGGLLPVLVVLEPASDGVAVDREAVLVAGRERTTLRVTLEAPPETGYYRRSLVERRYLAVLPTAWLLAMAGVHPWLPILVIDALVGAATVLAGLALLGRLPRRRQRSGVAGGSGSWFR